MVCGWLSPEGTYYKCSTLEHEEKAEIIASALYGSGDSVLLESYGWIRIEFSGRILYTKTPTEKQLSVLESMIYDVDPFVLALYLTSVGDAFQRYFEDRE